MLNSNLLIGFVGFWPAYYLGKLLIPIVIKKISNIKNWKSSILVANKLLWPTLSSRKISGLEKLLRFAGYRGNIPNVRIIFVLFLIVLLGLLFFRKSFFWGFVGAMVLIIWVLKRRAKKFEDILTAQIPEALTNVGESLRAGFSFNQAIAFVSHELPEPIGLIYKAMVRGLNQGLNLSDVFEMVYNQVPMTVLKEVNEYVLAGLSSGGNIIPMLSNQANHIRSELKSVADIKSLTAAGRSSGFIIAFLAPAVFVFFWVLSPSYMDVFFGSLLGKILFAISCLLEIIGFVWIQKIVNIKFYV